MRNTQGFPPDPKYYGDVHNKTFFTHVTPENHAIVSKSAVFTHVRSRTAPWSRENRGQENFGSA